MTSKTTALGLNKKKAFDCEVLLSQYAPFLQKFPRPITNFFIFLLKKLVHEAYINAFLKNNANSYDFNFIEKILLKLEINLLFEAQDIMNIPDRGRVIIIANHPLGGLDGLALLSLVSRVRYDVRIVVNEILLNVDQMKNLFLPVDVLSGRSSKPDNEKIYNVLRNDEAVIIFPSGEVSRAGLGGIRDRTWLTGFLRLAEATKSPILPVHIKAYNSCFFYVASWISRRFSMLMLPREMVSFKGSIKFTVGHALPLETIKNFSNSLEKQALLVSEHLKQIGLRRKDPLSSPKTIIISQDRFKIQKELQNAEVLGETIDKKQVLLLKCPRRSVVLDEIGRLREEIFRLEGEGTGQSKDIDYYDHHYRQLILWDTNDLEIVGAYRFGEVWKWRNKSHNLLYSASLFNFSEAASPMFAVGLELGRSFIQPKYRGKLSLHYLWQGIGAYLAQHPNIKYLFGPVSLSRNLPKRALDLIVSFYSTFYPDSQNLVCAKSPYLIDKKFIAKALNKFNGASQETAFLYLKGQLDDMGISVPILYKQYANLCHDGGTRFCGFNIDTSFKNCIDGLVIVDLEHLKQRKRKRYISRV